VGTSIRTAAILLGKLNVDQSSLSRTQTARIESLYVLKPAHDAYIKVLGDDSHILASDWLLWLNQNALLIESDPTGLGSLLPLINQLSTESSNIVDSDAMGDSSSPIVSLQVDLPAEEQEYPASSSRSDNDSTAPDRVLDSRLDTPQASVAGLARSLSLKRPPTVLSLHIPSPSPLSGCPTPSSAVSIVDYDDDNWSVAVVIDSVPPSRPRVPSLRLLPPWRSNWGCELDRRQRWCACAHQAASHRPPALPRRFGACRRCCPSPRSQAYEHAPRLVVLNM